MLPWGQRIGIDLGTSHTEVCLPEQGVVVREATAVAYTDRRRRPIALGEEARLMAGKDIPGLRVVRPVVGGVVADFDAAVDLLRHCLRGVLGRRPVFAPVAIAAATSESTEVERRALHDCLRSAGAGRAYLVPKCLAAGLGSELPMEDASSRMVVDIGAGTTDIGILSMGAVTSTNSLHYAGDDLDEGIRRWVKRRHDTVISRRAAEELKVRVAAVEPALSRESGSINGLEANGNSVAGLRIPAEAIPKVLAGAVMPIIGELSWMLDNLPAERRAELTNTGIVLTGGSSLLRGLPDLFQEKLQVPVTVARDPLSCTVLGIEYIMANLENLSLEGRRYARLSPLR
ncbi:MAG: rod shape-determining protein [Armatimonadota bacterium]